MKKFFSIVSLVVFLGAVSGPSIAFAGEKPTKQTKTECPAKKDCADKKECPKTKECCQKK